MQRCNYVSMYLCIYVTMYLCIYVTMYLCNYLSMYLCNYVSMYLCIYVSMSLCIYVYVYCTSAYVYCNTSVPSLELPRHFSTGLDDCSHCHRVQLSFSSQQLQQGDGAVPDLSGLSSWVLITSTLPQNHGFVMVLCMLQLFFARFVVLARD